MIQTSVNLFDEHKSQRNRMIELFESKPFVSTAELRLFSYQYNARIFELRQLGYSIFKAKQNGKCGFCLIGKSGVHEK
jgi:hypothetical protein